MDLYEVSDSRTVEVRFVFFKITNSRLNSKERPQECTGIANTSLRAIGGERTLPKRFLFALLYLFSSLSLVLFLLSFNHLAGRRRNCFAGDSGTSFCLTSIIWGERLSV